MSSVATYYRYTRERFPLIPALIYTGSQYYAAYFFAGCLGAGPARWLESALGWLVLFGIILRLRVTDEHKDYERDRIAYPERMLSRGQITLKDLKRLFAVALVLEIGICAFLGWEQLAVWAMIQLWFFLMMAEFFAPRFLNAHIGVYLVTHQLLVPFMALLPMSQRVDLLALSGPTRLQTVLFLVALNCATITYEIARKIWEPERENENAVSYSGDWGRGLAVLANQAFALAAAGTFTYLGVALKLNVWFLALWVASPVFLGVSLVFLKRQTRSWAKRIELLGAVHMLAVLIGATLAFALRG